MNGDVRVGAPAARVYVGSREVFEAMDTAEKAGAAARQYIAEVRKQ